jgi:N-acyl-D-amino-acid deacylase
MSVGPRRLVITGGLIIDGTGAPPRRGDLAVVGDRIEEIGERVEVPGDRLDADGLAMAPGFIDMHSHTDYLVLGNPTAESKLIQGVTTEVGGNCGESPAPVVEETARDIAEWLGKLGVEAEWDDFEGFFARLQERGTSINFASFVGHGALRALAMGYGGRAPSDEELGRMRAAARTAIEQGAVGISSGLCYPPGCYAETDELAAVAHAAAPLGGIYVSHLRNEGDRLLEAVGEALEIGRRAGLPVHLSHHKVTDPWNWGRVADSLAMIDEARARGQAVTADQYPYLATSTGLATALPDWMREGGRETMLARLRDPEARGRAAAQMIRRARAADHWDRLMIASVETEANRPCCGRSVAAIARDRGLSPPEAIFELLLEEDARVAVVRFAMCEEDVERVMRHPWVAVASDAAARASTGPLSEGRPHPRAFGTFPRVLGRYVRERGVLSLEQAIRKMTGLPAGILGLRDRGVLRPGARADIVVFDPATIADRATFESPLEPPVGIHHVVVNGQLAFTGGTITDARPGRVLRRAGAVVGDEAQMVDG